MYHLPFSSLIFSDTPDVIYPTTYLSPFHCTPGNSAGCTAKEKDLHQHPNTGCRPQSRAQAGRGCTRKGSSSCSRLPFPSPVRGARRRVENAPGRYSHRSAPAGSVHFKPLARDSQNTADALNISCFLRIFTLAIGLHSANRYYFNIFDENCNIKLCFMSEN